MKLSPEESLLFLTCLAYPDDEGDHSIGRLVRLPLNWEQIVWRSEHCRTTPLLWYHLCRLGLQETVPDHIRHYLSCWTALSSRRSESLYGELIHIIQAFDQAGIAYYTFKGTALSALFYPNPLIRPMLDLDFMVVPDQVPAAREVMVRLGYLHAFWDSDTNAIKPLMPNQIAQYQNEHYELPIFMKRVRAESPVALELIPNSWRRKHLKCHVDSSKEITFAVFVDLHFNLSIGFDLEDVWRGAHEDSSLGLPMRVQSTTAMFWFIASRLYHEAFQFNTVKLIMLGDLHTILTKQGGTIDWDELVAVADKYGMQAPLYYVLAQLSRNTSARVPASVLETLRPDRGPFPRGNDWGDVMPKLFFRAELHDVSLT